MSDFDPSPYLPSDSIHGTLTKINGNFASRYDIVSASISRNILPSDHGKIIKQGSAVSVLDISLDPSLPVGFRVSVYTDNSLAVVHIHPNATAVFHLGYDFCKGSLGQYIVSACDPTWNYIGLANLIKVLGSPERWWIDILTSGGWNKV